jgi:hypothetical protein
MVGTTREELMPHDRRAENRRDHTGAIVIVWLFTTFAFASGTAYPASPERDAQSDPVITFGDSTITAQGITPGKQVVFFGITFRGPNRTHLMVDWKKVVSDDDHDGAVVLNTGEFKLEGSVWVVVDLTNARYAIASPPAWSYNTTSAPRLPFRHSRAGSEVDQFAFDHPVLELLYVHPGLGAWVWSARDGGYFDRDGAANGVTTVNISDGKPLTERAASTRFVPGGLLIAIDWFKLEVLAFHIDENAIGSAR